GRLADVAPREGGKSGGGAPVVGGGASSPSSPRRRDRRQVRRTVAGSHWLAAAIAWTRPPPATARTIRARRTWNQGAQSVRASRRRGSSSSGAIRSGWGRRPRMGGGPRDERAEGPGPNP